MHDPPSGVVATQVLDAVRAHWDADVDGVAHLAVGFGAHHWAASASGRPRLFVTLDPLGTHHDPTTLEATYTAAATVATTLPFVVAGLPSSDGARAALVERLPALATWVAAYHRLAGAARGRSWVPTHGEPHERNQLVSPGGLRLVDWESLRLDEVAQYAARFERPHGSTADDRTALAGLLGELARS